MNWKFWELFAKRTPPEFEALPPRPPDPRPALVKKEAVERRAQTAEVLRVRAAVIRKNHIADDIGRAYLIINRGRL